MGSFNFTDNCGVRLNVGDHVGYISKTNGHLRIHTGTVKKLLSDRLWIMPDEDFVNDARIPSNYEEQYKKLHPTHNITKYDRYVLISYGKVIKL